MEGNTTINLTATGLYIFPLKYLYTKTGLCSGGIHKLLMLKIKGKACCSRNPDMEKKVQPPLDFTFTYGSSYRPSCPSKSRKSSMSRFTKECQCKAKHSSNQMNTTRTRKIAKIHFIQPSIRI